MKKVMTMMMMIIKTKKKRMKRRRKKKKWKKVPRRIQKLPQEKMEESPHQRRHRRRSISTLRLYQTWQVSRLFLVMLCCVWVLSSCRLIEGQTALHSKHSRALSTISVSNNVCFSIVTKHPQESLSHLREIGKEALCWQLSSAKPGNGVEQIRDASLDTYWQSDGTKQPHWIQVHFARRVAVSHVCLYLDYSLDESYTPKKVCVQHGMTNQDLQAAVHPSNTQIEFSEPVGWCIVPLSSPPDPLDDCCGGGGQDHENGDTHIHDGGQYQRNRLLVRTHLLRISIITMHQNGRDTHIRQVLLYGPRMMQESTYLPRIHHSSLAAAQQPDTDENVVPPVHGANHNKNDDVDDDDSDLGNFMMQPFGTIR
jgi:anaphase-promoting complex subunit 10